MTSIVVSGCCPCKLKTEPHHYSVQRMSCPHFHLFCSLFSSSEGETANDLFASKCYPLLKFSLAASLLFALSCRSDSVMFFASHFTGCCCVCYCLHVCVLSRLIFSKMEVAESQLWCTVSTATEHLICNGLTLDFSEGRAGR